MAALVGACALSGCGSRDDAASPERTPDDPGCGACTAQTRALEADVARLPGVRDVARLSYTAQRNITRLANLSMDLRVRRGQTDAVAEAVLETAWQSQVTPLQSVRIASLEPGQDLRYVTVTLTDDVERDLQRRLGPRPVD